MAKNTAPPTDETANGTEPEPETPTRRKSLADLAGGMGRKLEEIEGETVTVLKLEFEQREVRALKDEPEKNIEKGQLVTRDVAFIYVDAQPEPSRYYTFSDPLIGKLRSINPEELPAEGVFERIDIDDGKRVWSIS